MRYENGEVIGLMTLDEMIKHVEEIAKDYKHRELALFRIMNE